MDLSFLSQASWIILTAAVSICSIILLIIFKIKSARQENNYPAEGWGVLAVSLLLLTSFFLFPAGAFYSQTVVALVLTFLIGIPIANSKMKKKG